MKVVAVLIKNIVHGTIEDALSEVKKMVAEEKKKQTPKKTM